MERKKVYDFAKVTENGKLYVTTEDFFKSDGIREMVIKLKSSSIVKNIEEKKRKAIQEKETI